MVTFKINGKKVKAEKGTTVLDAARASGIEIPTLCSNEALEPYGACRLCIVEIEKGGRTAVESSCTYIVEDGLTVKTDSKRVIEGRKMSIELLLARCSNVKIVRDLAEQYEIADSPLQWSKENDYCILCGLCVRACNEVVKAGAIQFAGRGADKIVDSPFHQPAQDCILCGSCAFVCPTGIIKKNDLGATVVHSPDGCEQTGPKREILNWQVEGSLKECSACGNPYAPELHLAKITRNQNLLKEFFNLCPSCRTYPVIDEDQCLGCGACMESCSVGAIEFDDKVGCEKKAVVFTGNCTGCHTCEHFCPVQAIS